MSSQDKKIVNTEEQNRTVNRGENRENENDSDKDSFLKSGTKEAPAETENPDEGSEIETPHRIEGDDAGRIERKIPNM
jgi:hypothetical protein